MDNSADYTSAALINMAGNVTGQGLSYANQKKLVEKQNNFNREMAELQNQWNIDAWNRTNEYNTPAKQIERLQAAGLSPYLAYGHLSGGQAQPLKMADAPVKSAGPAYDFVSTFRNLGESLMSWIMQKREPQKMDLQNDILAEQLADWQGRNAGRRLAGTEGAADGLSDADYMAMSYGSQYRNALDKMNLQNMLLNQRFAYVPKQFNLNQQKLQLGRDTLDFRRSQWQTNKALIDAKKWYQDQVNDWFEINQWSNLIYKGADLLLKFVPIPRLFGKRGGGAFKRVSTTYY